MDLMDAIASRRSIRDFVPEPVKASTLRRLIKAATQAPSAMNEQPWQFTVVTSKSVLSKISENAKAYLLEQLAEGSHINNLRHTLSAPGFDIFYGAQALVVISAPSHLQWAVADCALAAENLMLAACADNLGSCWIGLAQPWLASTEGRKAIGLDETATPIAPLIVGYPTGTPAPVPRHEPRIHWID